MNQKNIVSILVVLLIGLAAVGGYFYSKANALSSGVKEFSFILKDKKYIPDTVKVKLGDSVTFKIDNQDDEVHGLHLKEFGVAESIPPLQKVSFQFKATQTGSLATTCAVGHPENITVIVES